jgi:hypothetical protein
VGGNLFNQFAWQYAAALSGEALCFLAHTIWFILIILSNSWMTCETLGRVHRNAIIWVFPTK